MARTKKRGSYKHPSGTTIHSYNSHREHRFYEETTKREMLLIIEQLAGLQAADGGDTWLDVSERERELLKLNGIT